MTSINRANEAFIGMLKGVAIVASYMKESEPLLDVLLKPSIRETYMRGQFLRVSFWMLTLEKLNTPRDIQAIQACTRSLLEIAVDMVLLHHDKTNDTVRKMLHWDRSQKLKLAEPMLAYYRKIGSPVPGENKDVEDFVKREKVDIEKKRLALWPNADNRPRHPNRWSGSTSLLTDVISADRVHGTLIKEDLNATLEEIYETEYRMLNWYVHGSGLTGVLKLPTVFFYQLATVAYNRCSDLAMLCIRIIFTDYGLTAHLPGLRDKWLRLKLSRGFAYLSQVGTPLSQDHE